MKKTKKMPSLPSLESLLDYDFHYYMEYDYQTERHCIEYGCDSICRCSTIEDFELTYIPVVTIANKFCEISNDTFEKYCIHRAVVASKLWNKDYWYTHIQHSYYGEEISSITLESEVKNVLRDLINNILEATTHKHKLFLILEKEYGYILPALNNFDDFEIISVKSEEIHAEVQEHYKRLEKSIVDAYKGYSLPIGVGIRKDRGIQLIDGYHRFAANTNKEVEIIIGVNHEN